MAHLLIQGDGGKYLPFARSLLAKLRRLRLYATSQSVEVSGYRIHVDINGPHETITIKGGGGWVAYPVAADLRTSTSLRRPTVDVTPHIPVPGPVEPVFELVPPLDIVYQPSYPDYYIVEVVYTVTFTLPPLKDAEYWRTYATSRDTSAWCVVNYDGGIIPTPEQLQSHPEEWGLLYLYSNTSLVVPGETGWISVPNVESPPGYHMDDPDAANYGQPYTRGEFRAKIDAENADGASRRIAGKAAEAHNAAEAARAASAYNSWYASTHAAWVAAVAAWQASEIAATAARNAAIEAAKAAARIPARPLQLARLYAEVDKGVNTPWMSLGTLPPPITPRVKHANPFPITIKEATHDPATDDDKVVFSIMDADGELREVEGTRKNQAQGPIEASCMMTYGRSVFKDMLVDKIVTPRLHQYFTRETVINPNQSFGYFATGYTDELEGAWQTAATFTTPPEYYDWLKSGMVPAGVNDVIESDAYVRPGAVLLLVHLEWETKDPFNQAWTWTPVPYALRYDSIWGCDTTGVHTGGEFIPDSPVRKVRLRKITKQELSKAWTWSVPAPVELPEGATFVHDVNPATDTGLSLTPPAIAVLTKLPAITVPPKAGGALAAASIYSARLKADDALKALRKTEWDSNPATATWIDRLVMEALNLTEIYRSDTE